MKVIITDHGYDHVEQEKKIINEAGIECEVHSCKTEDDVISCAVDADAIICQFAPITKRVLYALQRCKIVVRYAVGVDTIDLQAASEKNIYVCNVPDYGTEEVALHTVTLMLSMIRKISLLQQACRQGTWTYKVAKPITRLSGQTVGLVGFGRIPRTVATMLTGFNVKILVSDPFVTKEAIEQLGYTAVTLNTLVAQSDIISLHVPLSVQTHHIIDGTLLRTAQKKPILVNTARGGILDEQELVALLQENILSGVALDVSEKEPMDQHNPLLHMEQVLVTPHAAWYSEQSIEALQRSVAEEVVRVLSGDVPLNPVSRKN